MTERHRVTPDCSDPRLDDVFDLTDRRDYGYDCELPDGFAERWAAAKTEFVACQEVMGEAYSVMALDDYYSRREPDEADHT